MAERPKSQFKAQREVAKQGGQGGEGAAGGLAGIATSPHFAGVTASGPPLAAKPGASHRSDAHALRSTGGLGGGGAGQSLRGAALEGEGGHMGSSEMEHAAGGCRGAVCAPRASATAAAVPSISRQLSTESLQEKIARYEKFIDETLKVKLFLAQQERMDQIKEMEEYERLASTLKMLRDEKMTKIKTQMNIGCDLYMQAVVKDTSRVMVDVGLGFFAEMTLDEGLAFIDKKIEFIQAKVDMKQADGAEISAQIDVVLQGINELMLSNRQ